MKHILLLFGLPLLFGACATMRKSQQPLPTVKNFSPEKYVGTWHEVARLPNSFEKNLVAARATYGKMADGKISVHNEGLKSGGEKTEIRGAATPVGSTPRGEAKLKVRFDPFPASLFAGDYWILDLNEAHTRAIVGSPNRKFLWLLAKDPNATTADFATGIQRMKLLGFKMDELISNPSRLK